MSTLRKPQAIVISPNDKLYRALVNINPQWDFRQRVATPEQFNNEIDADSNVEIVLIPAPLLVPRQNNPYADEFLSIVADCSRSVFVGIILYPGKSPNEDDVVELIETKADELSIHDTMYVDFISASSPKHDLDHAISLFAENIDDKNVRETIAIITGKDVDDLSREDTDDDMDDDDDYDFDPFDVSYEGSDAPSDYMGRVVSITSSKGGVGKSTVAMTLATFLAQQSHRSVSEGLESRPLKILLMDMDVLDGQVGFLTQDSRPTIVNLRDDLTNERIDETVIHKDNLGIDVLLASKKPTYQLDFSLEFYRELVHRLKKKYDYIIFDTSVSYLDPLLSQICYPLSEKIVFVTEPVITSVMSMARWIVSVTSPSSQGGQNLSKERIGIVLNKYLGTNTQYGNVNYDIQAIQKATFGSSIVSVVPAVPSLVSASANSGRMDKMLTNKGVRDAIENVAQYVVGDSYKLP